MKLEVGWIAVIALLPLISCHSAEQKANQQLEEQRHQEADRQIADLRARYNPVVDWPQQIEGKTFTIDVEPIFLRVDDHPVLFYVILEDAKSQSGKTILYFTTVRTGAVPPLRLILDCASCDLQLLKKTSDSFDDLAVVAQITAAERYLDGPEDAPDFVLHGTFVDARDIGDYATSKLPGS